MKNKKLPGDYIAGFVDGEGCFALKFRRDVRYDRPGKPTYFYWDIEFAVMLRKDDVEILKEIQETLGCGRISITRRTQAARYAVNNLDDLGKKVIPFFNRYKLRAKKQYDFKLWEGAFEILKRNERKTVGEADTKKLKEIHNKMMVYKSSIKPWKWLPG